jgi:hypothetical protein
VGVGSTGAGVGSAVAGAAPAEGDPPPGVPSAPTLAMSVPSAATKTPPELPFCAAFEPERDRERDRVPSPVAVPESSGDGEVTTTEAGGRRELAPGDRAPGPEPPTIPPAETRPSAASVPALSSARTAVATPVVLPASAAIRARLMVLMVACCARSSPCRRPIGRSGGYLK